MNKEEKINRRDDIPENVRLIIKREIDGALRTFRSGNFEARLQSMPKRQLTRKGFVFGLPRWAAIPAFGTAAVIIILGAILWFGRARPVPEPKEPLSIDTALNGLPGFQTLSVSRQSLAATAEAPSPDAAALSRALISAGSSATARGEVAAPAAGKLVPRYNLEEKMQILFGEKTIERALLIFKDKFKEV